VLLKNRYLIIHARNSCDASIWYALIQVKKVHPPAESPLIALTRAFAEIVSDGRLRGDIRQHVLLAPNDLIPTWHAIAPDQPVESIDRADEIEKCIVFDVDDDATATLLRLRQQRPEGSAISFLTEYYPSACAETLAPGRMADSLGHGLIMFQTPRTGSHLMQSMIRSTGDFGIADEWIRPPLLHAVRLGLVSLVDHLICCARHQQLVHKYWATSIVLPFLEEIWRELQPDEHLRFIDFVRSAHTFLLTRRDRVAQTWSQIRAVQSGRFHIYSQAEVNKNVGDALQPPEKFWVWLLHNEDTWARMEAFADTIVRQAGGTLPVVAYEELRERPISKDVHDRVFGPLYDQSAHQLDPDTSPFVRQSGAEDAEMIARLRRIREDTDMLDFAGWRGLERASVKLSGEAWIHNSKLQVRSGTIVCDIPFLQSEQRRTVGLQLDVLASDAFPVMLWVEVAETRKENYSAVIDQTGAYLLLAADRSARAGMRYVIVVGGDAVIGSDGARVRLRRLFSIPVDFQAQPEFPWMTPVQRLGNFALYRLA
jgi:LPS sulfotransferase NodH